MATFEEEPEEATTDLYPVFGKPTIADDWILLGNFTNQGAADSFAASMVANPHNYAKVRVCLPNGNLYKDVV